jgi:NADPH:quinone reductase-like Zn-dependent oxidoreductase
MRAWSYKTRGQPADVLNLTTDYTTPSPSNLGPNDVLVRIEYAALTPSASTLISVLPNWIHTLPAVPELMFSGTIAALGSDVAKTRPELTKGAPAFGGTSIQLYLKGHGTLADYSLCPAEQVVVKPDDISFRDAAALAGNGVTAVEVLQTLKLKKGDKVLINGGSGATGTMLVQCARDIVGESGRVVATCSEGNSEMVKRIGADEVRSTASRLESII